MKVWAFFTLLCISMGTTRADAIPVAQPAATVPVPATGSQPAHVPAAKALAPLKEQAYPAITLKQEGNRTIIPICTSYPLRGDSNIVSRQMLAGVENYLREFKFFTKTIDDKKLTYVIEHEKNNKSLGNIEPAYVSKLLSKSPIMLGVVDTEALLSLEPYLKRKQMLLLFPMEGSPAIRNKKYDNLIFFRPSHQRELEVLVEYALNHKHKDVVGILHEASTWGNSTAAALKKILREYKIEPVVVATYSQGTVDIDQALSKIAKKTPNVVFCLAKPRPAYTFISNAMNVGLHESLFLGLSDLNVIQKLLKTSRGLDITVTSVIPNTNADIPIARAYKKAMQSFLSFRDDSPFYFEAFINLALFEHSLKQIPGTAISIPGIISALEGYNNVDFHGITLSFNRADRSLSQALWINPGLNQPWIDATTWRRHAKKD